MEEKFESLIEGMVTESFSTLPGFWDPALVSGLRENLLQRYRDGRMHPAGIGKHFSYQKNAEIRGDVISWIDEASANPVEQQFLDQIQAFIVHLNRTCYTGINGVEFHYALYEEGSFYRRHLDRFRQDSGRRFSFVTYLNENWLPEDGGQLVAYHEDREISLLPEEGRVVFFKSDEVPHEVKPAARRRMSIAGWLLRL